MLAPGLPLRFDLPRSAALAWFRSVISSAPHGASKCTGSLNRPPHRPPQNSQRSPRSRRRLNGETTRSKASPFSCFEVPGKATGYLQGLLVPARRRHSRYLRACQVRERRADVTRGRSPASAAALTNASAQGRISGSNVPSAPISRDELCPPPRRNEIQVRRCDLNRDGLSGKKNVVEGVEDGMRR